MARLKLLPPGSSRLAQRTRAGDAAAAFELARRAGPRSVTDLVRLVWQAGTPAVVCVDACCDGFSAWRLCQQADRDDG